MHIQAESGSFCNGIFRLPRVRGAVQIIEFYSWRISRLRLDRRSLIRNILNIFNSYCHGLVAVGALFFPGREHLALEAIKRTVRFRFPIVQHLQPHQLREWFRDESRENPLLIDVRTREEYDYSHLPSAVQMDPAIQTKEALKIIGNARSVVLYCSVGYRSSKLAARLVRAGLTHVTNLEGSVFAWANEGFPLEKGGRPASKVHPYSRVAGKMLHENVRGNLK